MIHHPRRIVAFHRIEPDYTRRMAILASMAREQASHAVAHACARINPRFDTARFLAACNAL